MEAKFAALEQQMKSVKEDIAEIKQNIEKDNDDVKKDLQVGFSNIEKKLDCYVTQKEFSVYKWLIVTTFGAAITVIVSMILNKTLG